MTLQFYLNGHSIDNEQLFPPIPGLMRLIPPCIVLAFGFCSGGVAHLACSKNLCGIIRPLSFAYSRSELASIR